MGELNQNRKKWFSKHMLAGYLFFGLIFAGVVSAVYSQQYKYQRTHGLSNKQNSSQEYIVDVSTWNSCKNEEFGYEVKYPSDMKVLTTSNTEVACKTSIGQNSLWYLRFVKGNIFKNEISVIALTRENQPQSYWEGINSLNDHIKKLHFKKLGESSVDGVRFASFDVPKETHNNVHSVTMIGYHNNSLYEIEYYDEVDPLVLQLFLESFSFLK